MTEEGSLSVEFIYCACGCGFTRSKYNVKGRQARFINGHRSREKLNPNWKGGISHNQMYIEKRAIEHPYAQRRGYVMEHRLVMEQYLGRFLEQWEVVHHINGIKTDNRIENLEVMSKSEHRRIHQIKDKSDRFCKVCSSKKTTVNKFNHYKWYIFEDGFLCENCYKRKRYVKKSAHF